MTAALASKIRRPDSFRRSARGWAGFGRLLAWVSSVSVLGCGLGAAKAPDARIRRDTRIVHEECDTSKADARNHDANGDGRDDVKILYRAGRELCRALDLNFDGGIDAWVFRASDGTVRRKESDFDRDGRIDEIATYAGGALTSKQVATNLAGRLDTWQYYQGGVLHRAERDSDGDSVVDQWWEYPSMPRSDCAIVHSDVDGDGRPDPGATVDMCKDEGAGDVTESGEASTRSAVEASR